MHHHLAEPPPEHSGSLTLDLRLACQRIARRIRFESTLTVSPSQYSVLVALEKGPKSARELAEVERVSAPSMTRTLSCLADAGLIARDGDPDDKRRAVITLAPAGADVLARTRRERDSWMARHLDTLTDEERALLRAAVPVLRKIADS